MLAPPAAVPSTVPNGDSPVEELPSPPPEDQSDQAFKSEEFADTSSTSPAPTAQAPQPGMDATKIVTRRIANHSYSAKTNAATCSKQQAAIRVG